MPIPLPYLTTEITFPGSLSQAVAALRRVTAPRQVPDLEGDIRFVGEIHNDCFRLRQAGFTANSFRPIICGRLMLTPAGVTARVPLRWPIGIAALGTAIETREAVENLGKTLRAPVESDSNPDAPAGHAVRKCADRHPFPD